MAKSYEPCYTKTNKSGGSYTTCEGAQKKRKARENLKKGGAKPPMVKKKKKVGKNETPEQNEQKAFLKLQRLKMSQGFKGNYTGRINTGPLNPGLVSSVSFPVEPASSVGSMAKPQYDIDADLFLQVSQVMTQVGKENLKSVPEKWSPDKTPPLPLLKGAGNIAVTYKGEDKWTQVRIFNHSGTGKGKLYEATFQEVGYRVGHSSGDYNSEANIVAFRDIDSKEIIGFFITKQNRFNLQGGSEDHVPRRHWRFSDKKFEFSDSLKKLRKKLTKTYLKKMYYTDDMTGEKKRNYKHYYVGFLINLLTENDVYYNLPHESDKIQKAFGWGGVNADTSDSSEDLVYKVKFGTPIYNLKEDLNWGIW